MRIDTIWIAEFASAGWLESLGDYIDEEDRASFISVTEKINVFQCNLYAIPWDANIGLLYYRKDLLEKYNLDTPHTWDDLVKACLKISSPEHVYGYLWQGKQYEGLVCNFVECIGSNNGGIIDDAAKIIVDSEQNKIALDFMHDLIWKYRVSPQNTHSELMEESSRHFFQQGKGLFLRNWTYVWELCQEDPSIKGKGRCFSITQIFPWENRHQYMGDGIWRSIPDRRKKKQAWQLLKFLTSEEVQKELALNLSWYRQGTLLYKDPELLERLPFLPLVETALKDVQIRPNLPYYQWVSDVLQKHINKVLSNQTSSDVALRTINAKLEGDKSEFAEN